MSEFDCIFCLPHEHHMGIEFVNGQSGCWELARYSPDDKLICGLMTGQVLLCVEHEKYLKDMAA